MRPLGPWFPRISTRRRWRNYYSPETDILHRQGDDGKFTAHGRIRFRVFSFTPVPKELDDPTTTPVPIDVFRMNDGWRMARYQQEEPNPQKTTHEHQTFQEYVQTLPEHEALLLHHFELLAGDTKEVSDKITTPRN